MILYEQLRNMPNDTLGKAEKKWPRAASGEGWPRTAKDQIFSQFAAL